MIGFLAFCDDEANLAMSDPGAFQAYLRRFVGKDVSVTVRKWQDKRSLDQNAYWWAVPVKILAAECGYTASQMHYALLGECFGYFTGPTGKPVPVKPSSSELTVGDFSKLIEWVLAFGPTELGIMIPAPDDPIAIHMTENPE